MMASHQVREDDAEESTKRETEGLEELRKQSREGRTGQSGGRSIMMS